MGHIGLDMNTQSRLKLMLVEHELKRAKKQARRFRWNDRANSLRLYWLLKSCRKLQQKIYNLL